LLTTTGDSVSTTEGVAVADFGAPEVSTLLTGAAVGLSIFVLEDGLLLGDFEDGFVVEDIGFPALLDFF
jgi:hypothetical protein